MKALVFAAATSLFLIFSQVQAAESGPSLSMSPSGSFILLEGTDQNEVEHVVHSMPTLGIDVDLAFQGLIGSFTPKFEFSTRDVRFYGSNNESIDYNPGYYNGFSAGVEGQILNSWVASGWVGYSQELYLWSPTSNALEIDKVNTPTASVRTSVGVFDYHSYVFAANAKAIAYFPVSTPNYSAKLGYGFEPSVSTSHYFSNHISGSAELYYLKRTQDSSAFDMIEQDFGLSLSIQLVD